MLLVIVKILKSNNSMETAALIIACASLLFTAITFFIYDHRLKKQDRILKDYELKNILATEEDNKKAHIKANIIKGDKANRILKVFNSGKAKASNIRFEFVPENNSFMFYDKEKFPFEFLNPQEGTSCTFMIVKEYAATYKIRLTWDDSFGKDREYEQILTL